MFSGPHAYAVPAVATRADGSLRLQRLGLQSVVLVAGCLDSGSGLSRQGALVDSWYGKIRAQADLVWGSFCVSAPDRRGHQSGDGG